MSEPITKEEFRNGLAGIAVVILIFVALIVYSVPAKVDYRGYETTVTATAVSIETQVMTSTDDIVNTVVHTINFTSTTSVTATTTDAVATINRTLTQTVTSTLSQSFPASVNVTGTVHSNAPLSTATYILFLEGGVTHTAPVSNGAYSIPLPNNLTYQVQIQYSLPVEGSSCVAGSFVLNAVGPLTNENWSC